MANQPQSQGAALGVGPYDPEEGIADLEQLKKDMEEENKTPKKKSVLGVIGSSIGKIVGTPFGLFK